MKKAIKITVIVIIVLVAVGVTLHTLDPFGIRQH
jgi:hypothetical protein